LITRKGVTAWLVVMLWRLLETIAPGHHVDGGLVVSTTALNGEAVGPL
jgi:hypothetical protein